MRLTLIVGLCSMLLAGLGWVPPRTLNRIGILTEAKNSAMRSPSLLV